MLKKLITPVLILIALSIIILYFVKMRPTIEEAQAVAETYSVQTAEQAQAQPPIQVQLGGPFELTDFNGKPRKDQDYRGQYMLVYFGYTYCPDICPAALYNLSQALEKLPPQQLKTVAPIFITVDPSRDTQEHLKLYLSSFHPNIDGLTGTQAQIDQAKEAYKVFAQRAKPDGTSTDYLMDHTSLVYVMDPKGQFVTSFNHETPAPKIIEILSSLPAW